MSGPWDDISPEHGKRLRKLSYGVRKAKPDALVNALTADIEDIAIENVGDEAARAALVNVTVKLNLSDAEFKQVKEKFTGRGKLVPAGKFTDAYRAFKREHKAQDEENAGTDDSTPLFLDESGDDPRITERPTGTPVLGRDIITSGGKRHLFLVIEEVIPRTSKLCFGVAVRVMNPGEAVSPDQIVIERAYADKHAQRYIIKRTTSQRSPGEVLYAGSIAVTRKYREYLINGMRELELRDFSRNVMVEAVNHHGIKSATSIPLMNLKTTGDRQSWLDRLDLITSAQPSMLRTYIFTLTDRVTDDAVMIVGQGPVYLPDGVLAFAAKSTIFDANGAEREELAVDIDRFISSAQLRYYDITPKKRISDEEVIAGIRELQVSLAECPEFPEIPAAFSGQLYTSPLVTIYPGLWSGLHLSGITQSGKTLYCLRWDAIESRTLRTKLEDIRPALPMGDTTGTVKGMQYRSRDFSGYAITTDDVLKKGDTDYRIREQTDKVQNLTRSFETGGAPRARVDHVSSSVISAIPPQLDSSIRLTTEIPLTGDSLRNRLIMLPHLANKWADNGAFDHDLASRLSDPENIEIQHRAWSMYVHWLMAHHTEVSRVLDRARVITEEWGLRDGRVSYRYAALVAGHLLFAEFAATYAIDYSEDATRSIDALRVCAIRQVSNSVPEAVRFAEALRAKIVTKELAFPGPPEYDPDGMESASWTPPGIVTGETEEEDGTRRAVRSTGGFTYEELGLTLSANGIPQPSHSGRVLGYLVPPRADNGGHKGDPLTRKWHIAFTGEQFKAVCAMLSKGSYVYSPDNVVTSLKGEKKGNRDRIHVSGRHARYVYVDAEFLLRSTESD